MNNRDIHIHVRISRRALIWAAAVVLLCCSANEVVSESMTMTTYYPAPAGTYQRLSVTRSVRFSPVNKNDLPAPPPKDGELIYDGSAGQFYYYKQSAWADLGGSGGLYGYCGLLIEGVSLVCHTATAPATCEHKACGCVTGYDSVNFGGAYACLKQ
ncbi:MAG: hypothetical protein NTY77_06890 [Elusimicrobia bacterium]|nr:hypothetical protein [Elusimicrobiota bacterium]